MKSSVLNAYVLSQGISALGLLRAVTVAAVLFAGAASAHHSFAAYDLTKTVTVSGTIKDFRWGAPHSSLLLTYRDGAGRVIDLMVQSNAPAAFVKQGFNPRDFHAGDKVELGYHPNRNGSLGGAIASLKLPDGRVFHDIELSNPATGANVPGADSSAPPAGPGPPPADAGPASSRP
jgi:hypothetical protein